MEKNKIITEIENRMGEFGYTIWYIGITNDPLRRKNEHSKNGHTEYWLDWEADNEDDAREIEEIFIKKGMNGGEGGGSKEDRPYWVYIF